MTKHIGSLLRSVHTIRLGVFLLLLAMVTANALIFSTFFTFSYFKWYLSTGFVVAAVVALIDRLTREIEGVQSLISTDPLRYISACCHIAGLISLSIATPLNSHSRSPRESWPVEVRSSPHMVTLDQMSHLLMSVLFIIGTILWIFVYAPLNYFFTIIVGGPARCLLRSQNVRTIWRKEGANVVISEQLQASPVQDGAIDISLARHPFAMTQAMLAVTLWVGNMIYDWLMSPPA